MLMMSHYELHDDELDRLVAFLSLRESCQCVVEMFDCFKVSLSESFQRRSGRPTVLVPIVSSPNNNCFGIRLSDMRAT